MNSEFKELVLEEESWNRIHKLFIGIISDANKLMWNLHFDADEIFIAINQKAFASDELSYILSMTENFTDEVSLFGMSLRIVTAEDIFESKAKPYVVGIYKWKGGKHYD